MINTINRFFVNIDTACDYIPVISTVNNLTDLFLKCTLLKQVSSKSVNENHYFKHLNNKSHFRCILLLIPGIGNFIISIYDLYNRKFNNKDCMLRLVRENGGHLMNASERLRGDIEVVLAATKQNYLAYKHASAELQNDPDVWVAIVNKSGCELKNAPPEIKENEMVVLAAIKQNFTSFEYASERLRNSKNFTLKAIQINCRVIKYAGETPRDDSEVMLAVANKDRFLIGFASDKLKGDREFILSVCRLNVSNFRYASSRLWKDPAFLKAYRALQEELVAKS